MFHVKHVPLWHVKQLKHVVMGTVVLSRTYKIAYLNGKKIEEFPSYRFSPVGVRIWTNKMRALYPGVTFKYRKEKMS